MRWANAEHTGIDMVITIAGQKLPFTARADDPEIYGRELFSKAINGEFGEIGEFVNPVEKQIEDLGGDITHHFSDGLYAKESFVPAGMAIMKHTHNFSHLSILAKGRVAVMKGDLIEIVDAPACIEIKANVVHGIKAMSDCVWFCIHATDEKDPSKVDEVLIRGE